MAAPDQDPVLIAREAKATLPRALYLARLEELVDKIRDHDQLLATRTLAYLEAGELEVARQTSAAHLSKGRSPEALIAQARLSFYEARLEESERLTREALAGAPGSAFVHAVAADCRIEFDFDETLRLARRAVELDPDNPENYRWIVRAYVAYNRYDEAEELVLTGPGCYRASYWFYYDSGSIAYHRHQFPEAERFLKTAVEMAPQHQQGWSALAPLLWILGRQDEAAEAAQKALDANRRNLSALRTAARVSGARGEFNTQAKLLAWARDAWPVYGHAAHFQVAVEFQQRHQIVEAVNAYRLAIKDALPRPRREWQGELLVLLADLARWRDLRQELDNPISAGVRPRRLAYARALLLRQEGKQADAIGVLETVGRDADDHASAELLLARLYKEQGEFLKADRLAEEVLAFPADTALRSDIAYQMLLEVGRLDEARRHLCAELAKHPRSTRLIATDAERLLMAGENTEATRQMMRLPAAMRKQLLAKVSARRRANHPAMKSLEKLRRSIVRTPPPYQP